MIPIYYLPIIFILIYKDQKSGKIEFLYWKVLFLFNFSLLLLINPQKFFLVYEIFSKFGMIFCLFLLFLISIKIFGGADVLFLIFLFFCAKDEFLVQIYSNFIFFLKNVSLLVIAGLWNKDFFVNDDCYIEKHLNLFKIGEFPIRNKSKPYFSPQFFFIFLSFF